MNLTLPHCSALTVGQMLAEMQGRRIAVIGDLMLDCYLHGPLERISPEAPVPVFEIDREEFKLGGAANVAACLTALGAQVKLAGIVGNDDQGRRLLREAGNLSIDVDATLVDANRPTTCKTRVVARNQQVLRLDRERRDPLCESDERQFLARVAELVRWADAIVLSDYAKGVLTPGVCSSVIRRSMGKPVIVDPKKLPWHHYRGATVLKPNRAEAEQFAQARADDHHEATRVAERIASTLDIAHVMITRGASGMTLVSREGTAGNTTSQHLPATRRELVDVTGAGDVVAATLATAMAAGAEFTDAAWLANAAAGVKVGKFGAASVTPHEILAAVGYGTPSFISKIMTLDNASSFAANARACGKRVVFTNGCFDLLHVGHVTCLERARQLGDVLIVGVNSDESVRRLKGSKRPLQNENDRAQILASQSSVDAVVVFGDDTPLELIRGLRPEIIAKGADYRRKESVVGWDLVESWGGKVVLIDLIEGRSTTRLVGKAA